MVKVPWITFMDILRLLASRGYHYITCGIV